MSDCNSTITPMEVSLKLSTNMSPKSEREHSEVENIPYQSAVGSLIHLVSATRPDIANAVGEVARFNSCYGTQHWLAVKRILRYLKGTQNVGICFSKTDSLLLVGYSDADWAGDIDRRRSTTGYIFSLSKGPISWKSQRQTTVALSSTEAEYMALTAATKEAIWMKKLVEYITGATYPAVEIKEDNQSTIKLVNNPVLHSRTKHIDIKYHFTRDSVKNGHIKINYCGTKDMIADILTKPLSGNIFQKLRHDMNMVTLEKSGLSGSVGNGNPDMKSL
jgi:hypothetical protein